MRELIYEQIHQILGDQDFVNMRFRTLPETLESMLDKKFTPSRTFNKNKSTYRITEDKLQKLDDSQLLSFYTYVIYRSYKQM